MSSGALEKLLGHSVHRIRWILVIVNLGSLATLLWMADGFFFGERDELRIQLPDAREFALKPTEISDHRRNLLQILATLSAEPPVTPPTPQPVVEQPPPPQPGGPIAKEWRILSALFIGDRGFATIEKKETKGSRRRINRSRSVRRTSKRSRRRRSRRANVAATKHVKEGRTLRIDGKDYFIQDIKREPLSIVYSDDGKVFVLTRNREETTIRRESGVLILDGKSEWDEMTPARPDAEKKEGTSSRRRHRS